VSFLSVNYGRNGFIKSASAGDEEAEETEGRPGEGEGRGVKASPKKWITKKKSSSENIFFFFFGLWHFIFFRDDSLLEFAVNKFFSTPRRPSFS
jgi:hypothetical protein